MAIVEKKEGCLEGIWTSLEWGIAARINSAILHLSTTNYPIFKNSLLHFVLIYFVLIHFVLLLSVGTVSTLSFWFVHKTGIGNLYMIVIICQKLSSQVTFNPTGKQYPLVLVFQAIKHISNGLRSSTKVILQGQSGQWYFFLSPMIDNWGLERAVKIWCSTIRESRGESYGYKRSHAREGNPRNKHQISGPPARRSLTGEDSGLDLVSQRSLLSPAGPSSLVWVFSAASLAYLEGCEGCVSSVFYEH